MLATLAIHLYLPTFSSLKEKRGLLSGIKIPAQRMEALRAFTN
jgi:hypothetical protein